MSRQSKSRQSKHFGTPRRGAWQATLCFAVALIAAPAWGQTHVVMVEEHWELQIGDPDPVTSAPQASMVMSPTADSEGVFFMFTLNHQNSPDYEPGGMQVQAWNGTELDDCSTGDESGTLSNSSEVVSWVQRIELHEGELTFGIHDGASETWGAFGGSDLSISTPTTLTGLDAYRPAVSLTESQVGYAENRVVSLVLTKLVWMTSDSVLHEQSAPIPLETSLEQ
jgi:hypothetical protein